MEETDQQEFTTMPFWTVQPRSVLETIRCQHVWVPTISRALHRWPSKDDQEAEDYADLLHFATDCIYLRLGLMDENGRFTEKGEKIAKASCLFSSGVFSQESIDDLAPVFAFASVIPSPYHEDSLVFEDMDFNDFKDFIAKHMFAIDSLWRSFSPDSVIMKLEMMPDDYVTMDINVWQFLMPPSVVLPPFSQKDYFKFSYLMAQPNMIIHGPLPSGVYQVILPYLVESNIVEVHEMVPYDEMKKLSDKNAQIEMIANLLSL